MFSILPNFHQHQPKSHHTTSLTILLLLTLPAALTTFLALFLLPLSPCDQRTARIQTLLILASFLFFSATLASLFLRLLLVPLADGEVVKGKRGWLVRVGLGLAWLEALLGWGVWGVVLFLFAGEGKGEEIGLGSVGLAGLGILILGVIVVGVGVEDAREKERSKDWEDRQPNSPPGTDTHLSLSKTNSAQRKTAATGDISKFKAVFILFILLAQFLQLLALVSLGVTAAVKAHVSEGCGEFEEETVVVFQAGYGSWDREGRNGTRTRTRTVVETSTVVSSGGSTVTVVSVGIGGSGSPSSTPPLGMQDTMTETQVLRTTTTVEVDPTPISRLDAV